MFYCRGPVSSSDGYIGYRYSETNYGAHNSNVAEPLTISDAQAICSQSIAYPTAIDAQIVYSDGITAGIGEFDWQNVYDAFGMSLLMFAVGAGIGIILNLVRKLR